MQGLGETNQGAIGRGGSHTSFLFWKPGDGGFISSPSTMVIHSMEQTSKNEKSVHSCRVNLIKIRGLWRCSLGAWSTETDRNKLSKKERPERWGCGIVICAQFCLCKSSDPAAESSQCVAGSTWRSRWRTGLTRTSLRPTKVNKPCMWDRITQLQHRLWVSWLEGTCSSWCTLNWIQVSSMLLQPRNPVTYTNHKVEKQLFPSPEQVWE